MVRPGASPQALKVLEPRKNRRGGFLFWRGVNVKMLAAKGGKIPGEPQKECSRRFQAA